MREKGRIVATETSCINAVGVTVIRLIISIYGGVFFYYSFRAAYQTTNSLLNDSISNASVVLSCCYH
jgi:hypothetical protein